MQIDMPGGACMPDNATNQVRHAADRSYSDNVIHFKGFRRKNYPYVHIWIVYYAWVIVFATWWTASPDRTIVFNTNLRTLLHSVILLSSALFIFVLKKQWYVKAARMGAGALLFGMVMNMLLPTGIPGIFSVIWVGVFVGCVNACILIPFIFTLNNTEKLYAVIGSNLLIGMLSFLEENPAKNYFGEQANIYLSFFLLLAGLAALPFFKEKDLPAEPSIPEPVNINPTPPRVYLTLVISCTFAILGKGIGKGLINLSSGVSAYPVLLSYTIGGLIGCLVTVLVYALARKSTQISLNITFGSMAIGLLFHAFSSQSPGLIVFCSLFLGTGSTIGMINTYYILGVIAKKYNSMRYARLSILFIGIFGGIAGVLAGNFVNLANSSQVSLVASILSGTVMILFLMISPALSQTLYEDNWAKDAKKKEVIDEHLPLFKKYNLTNRETEVCELLLKGHTLRQISGILAIAYPTVNTYCTAIYRKLCINSRTELLLLLRDYERR